MKQLLLLLAICAGFILAQPKPDKNCPGHQPGDCQIKAEKMHHPGGPPMPPPLPGLSEDQNKEIRKLEVDYRAEIQPVENKIGELQARIKTLAETDSPDVREINKLIDQVSENHSIIQKAEMKKNLAIRKLLTAEQKLVFDRAPKPHPGPMPPPPPPVPEHNE